MLLSTVEEALPPEHRLSFVSFLVLSLECKESAWGSGVGA